MIESKNILHKREIMLGFADDLVIEFKNDAEIKKWRETTKEIWNNYQLILSMEKSRILTLSKEEGKVENIPKVQKVKYLGIHISTNYKILHNNKHNNW